MQKIVSFTFYKKNLKFLKFIKSIYEQSCSMKVGLDTNGRFAIILRYDTRCYINMQSKADMSQLNEPHGTNNYKVEKNRKTKKNKNAYAYKYR